MEPLISTLWPKQRSHWENEWRRKTCLSCVSIPAHWSPSELHFPLNRVTNFFSVGRPAFETDTSGTLLIYSSSSMDPYVMWCNVYTYIYLCYPCTYTTYLQTVYLQRIMVKIRKSVRARLTLHESRSSPISISSIFQYSQYELENYIDNEVVTLTVVGSPSPLSLNSL
jgi:hypothetical protein